jgi:Protein of unknown function (DUF1570)
MQGWARALRFVPLAPAAALATGFGLAALGCTSFPILSNTITGSDRLDQTQVAAAAPGKNSFRVSQFVFNSDVAIDKNQPIFKELGVLPDQVYKDLRLVPSTALVQVNLFETRDKFEAFMHAKWPNLPKRRAFFVGQPKRLGGGDDLFVYTFWGEFAQKDLRHELTHALLHAVLKDVPIWLDEGLAEYYEMPPSWNGVNYLHVEALRKPDVKFDLARLEKLTEVEEMSPAEYREAWAWTHLMLKSTPQARQVLLAYLQELRTNPHPAPLRPRLERVFVNLDEALGRHLADLDLSKPRSTAASQ